MKHFKAVDAFCGAGGLSLGLSQAGFDILLGFDLDDLCINSLQHNTKYVKHKVVAADVKSMCGGRLLKLTGIKRGQLDLLAGGPPCQGFSVQRTVGGEEDSRNLLVDDYGDLITEVLPKFFLLENVPGIGGKRGRETLEKFIARMTSNGYFCHQNILDARDYGVPQRRKRYILVGEYINSNKPVFVFPKKSTKKAVTVGETIGWLPEPPCKKYALHRADNLSEINLQRIRAISAGQSREHLPAHLLAECHKSSADLIGHRNVYGRMAWDDVSPTITARFDSFTRGKFGHPFQDRSISLLEGALLQSFPKDYIFTGNKVDIARQIGNAVPPLLSKAIGKSIMSALEKKRDVI